MRLTPPEERARLVQEMRASSGTEAALALDAALGVETREWVYASGWDQDPWRLRLGRDVLARRLARRPIRVRLDVETLPSVLEHGLLTAHHLPWTVSHRAPDHLDQRRVVECAAFGIPLDAEPDERPRFGSIGGFADDYGATELVLRDEVKASSTFCVGDIMDVWTVSEVGAFDAPSGRAVVMERTPWRPRVDTPTDSVIDLSYRRLVEVHIHRPVTRDDIALVRGGTDAAVIAAAFGIRHEYMDGDLPGWWCDRRTRVTREERRIRALARATTTPLA